MTRFEYYSQSPEAMAELIEMAVDDALEAEGCSMDLRLPDPEICMTWEEWLEGEKEER